MSDHETSEEDEEAVEVDGRYVKDVDSLAFLVGAENIVFISGNPGKFGRLKLIHGVVDLHKTAFNIGRYVEQSGLHCSLRLLPDDIPPLKFLERVERGWLGGIRRMKELPPLKYWPTLSQEEYDQLLEVRKNILSEHLALAGKVSLPFPGVRGPHYGIAGSPKLVYVGKATYEGSLSDAEVAKWADVIQTAKAWGKVVPGLKTHFWQNLDAVCSGLAKRLGVPLDRTHTVWTNVAKIAGESANPQGPVFAAQKAAAIEIMQTEIRRLKPEIVWIVTGNWKAAFVHKIFDGQDGSDGWIRSDDDKCMYRCDYEAGCVLVWTNHPQIKERTSWQTQRDFLLDAAADFLKRRSN